MPDFKALLVGINEYHDGSTLRGCVNDVVIMREILREVHAVPEQSIRTLTDHRATKDGILERLEWLIDDSSNYRNLFFHYSGHGAQLPNQSYDRGDESDGMDEILCPVDFNWHSKFIRDDEIHKIISKKHPKCRLVMIFDCCHSGSVFRAPGNAASESPHDVRVKSIPTPVDLLCRSNEFSANKIMDVSGHGDRYWGFINPDVKSDQLPLVKEKKIMHVNNCLSISGCKDHQTSADAHFRNRYQGALTYCMQKHMYRQPELDVNGLVESTVRYLKSFGFYQDPVLNVGRETNTRQFVIVS